MTDIPKQLATALISAGYGKPDGKINLYRVQRDGICDAGNLSRYLAGTQTPSMAVLERICEAIGYDVELMITKRED
ncbi:helix-turn-helix domain-containing protein [Petrachloros mirabilis]